MPTLTFAQRLEAQTALLHWIKKNAPELRRLGGNPELRVRTLEPAIANTRAANTQQERMKAQLKNQTRLLNHPDPPPYGPPGEGGFLSVCKRSPACRSRRPVRGRGRLLSELRAGGPAFIGPAGHTCPSIACPRRTRPPWRWRRATSCSSKRTTPRSVASACGRGRQSAPCSARSPPTSGRRGRGA